jgi:hypothetical protein
MSDHDHEYTMEELVDLLSDKQWRMHNLYYVLTNTSQTVPFHPNHAQQRFQESRTDQDVILKARQLGFSTYIQVDMLDDALFNDNQRGLVIANSQRNAKRIMRDKLRFAYDRLPEIIRVMVPLVTDSQSELVFGNGSNVCVETSGRGGTWDYTHISELGNISRERPDAAHSIMTAVVPASRKTVVESTAEGIEGEYFDLVTKARTGNSDWNFMFYAWHDNPQYVRSFTKISLTEDDKKYFANVEDVVGKKLTTEQINWYLSKRDSLPDPESMHQEHPSYPDEAFAVSVDRCYYTTQYNKLVEDKRITTVPYDESLPVNTYWDIGVSDATVIWFGQDHGSSTHFIDYFENETSKPYSFFVKILTDRGYMYGIHYLPHDGNQRRPGVEENLTPQEMLKKLGVTNTEIVPRCTTKLQAINATRTKLSTAYFDESKCRPGIDHFRQYRKRWNRSLGVAVDSEPDHNEHSHCSDSLAQWGQCIPKTVHVNRHLRVKSKSLYSRR